MRTWELVKLALGGVVRRPLRVTLTALGVAIATGALVSMLAFALALQARAMSPFRKLDILNTVRVSAREKAPLDDAAIAKLAKLPGVAAAYPSIHVPLQVSAGEAKPQNAIAVALAPDASRIRYFRDVLVAGRLPAADRPREALLDAALAPVLGFDTPAKAVGATIRVHASGLLPGGPAAFRFEKQVVPFTVVGVIEPPRMEFGPVQRYVYLPLDTVRSMPGVPLEPMLGRLGRDEGPPPAPGDYAVAIVWAERPSEVGAVEKRIDALGYGTWTLVGQLQEMRKFFVLVDALLGAMGTVALVIAALGIVNTLLMAVLERQAEIGACKAIGASDGDIRVLFLAEAGLVGCLGGLAGLALGRAVSVVIGLGVNWYARRQGIAQPIATFEFPLWLLGGAVLFAIAASVVSGVYPASRAARIDPIRALRNE